MDGHQWDAVYISIDFLQKISTMVDRNEDICGWLYLSDRINLRNLDQWLCQTIFGMYTLPE